MAVIHFQKDGKILCNPKQRKNPPQITEKMEEVTCTRCLKRYKNRKNGIKYVNDKKHSHCLQIDAATLLKLGEDLDQPIQSMMLLNPKGVKSTSMSFRSTGIKHIISRKSINFLKKYFDQKKQENDVILVRDIIDDFND